MNQLGTAFAKDGQALGILASAVNLKDREERPTLAAHFGTRRAGATKAA